MLHKRTVTLGVLKQEAFSIELQDRSEFRFVETPDKIRPALGCAVDAPYLILVSKGGTACAIPPYRLYKCSIHAAFQISADGRRPFMSRLPGGGLRQWMSCRESVSRNRSCMFLNAFVKSPCLRITHFIPPICRLPILCSCYVRIKKNRIADILILSHNMQKTSCGRYGPSF